MTTTVPPVPRTRPLSPPPGLGRLPAVRFGAAHGTLLLAAAAFTALHLAPLPALVLVGVLVVGWAGVLPITFAAALGAVSWAYYTGFAVNGYGLLTFHAGDLDRLALLVALAVGVALAAHWRR